MSDLRAFDASPLGAFTASQLRARGTASDFLFESIRLSIIGAEYSTWARTGATSVAVVDWTNASTAFFFESGIEYCLNRSLQCPSGRIASDRGLRGLIVPATLFTTGFQFSDTGASHPGWQNNDSSTSRVNGETTNASWANPAMYFSGDAAPVVRAYLYDSISSGSTPDPELQNIRGVVWRPILLIPGSSLTTAPVFCTDFGSNVSITNPASHVLLGMSVRVQIQVEGNV